jgi:hypothetical protein
MGPVNQYNDGKKKRVDGVAESTWERKHICVFVVVCPSTPFTASEFSGVLLQGLSVGGNFV